VRRRASKLTCRVPPVPMFLRKLHVWAAEDDKDPLFRIYGASSTFTAKESSFTTRPCLVPRKFCKIFQILCHIESLTHV
jgi:hypothetical protein